MTQPSEAPQKGTRIRRFAIPILVVAAVVVVLGPIGFKVMYDRAVSICVDEAPGNVTGAEHGWQWVPPGFWCERQFDNGRRSRTNLGPIPGI